MKINWGWAVVIALASFMLFISVIVFQLLFKKEYDHELVSKNYYKDELLYQLEVTKLENAKKLPQDIEVKNVDGKLTVVFPENMNYSEIQGTVFLQYVIDEQQDFELPLVLNNQNFAVESEKLVKGLWYIKVAWSYQNVSYLYKNKIKY